jgi:hypothetical protein
MQSVPNWLLLVAVFVAVAAWGVFHAVGAYQLNFDIRRPLVVLAAFAFFLGGWLALLAYRRWHISNDRPREPGS